MSEQSDDFNHGYRRCLVDLAQFLSEANANLPGGTYGGGSFFVSSNYDAEEHRKTEEGGNIPRSLENVNPNEGSSRERARVTNSADTGKTPQGGEESREIAAIWAVYVSLIAVPKGLRTRTMEQTHRTLIKSALRVRSKVEIIRAIEGLACSPHHNGQNDRGKKYLNLRYALKGNQNTGESNGERIDKAGTWVEDPISGILASIPSEGRAILLNAKRQVELALAKPGDEIMQRRAAGARERLRETWHLVATLQNDGAVGWRVVADVP